MITPDQRNAVQIWRATRCLVGVLTAVELPNSTEYVIRAEDGEEVARFRTAGVNGWTPEATAERNLADLSDHVPGIWTLFRASGDKLLAHAEHGIVTNTLAPEWFLAVDAEYRKLEAHPESIVLEPEQLESMWAQAYASADMSVDDDLDYDGEASDDQREHAVLTEAAKRVAAAVAILAYGIDYPLFGLLEDGETFGAVE